MGTRPLHEILSERETISGNMQVCQKEFDANYFFAPYDHIIEVSNFLVIMSKL